MTRFGLPDGLHRALIGGLALVLAGCAGPALAPTAQPSALPNAPATASPGGAPTTSPAVGSPTPMVTPPSTATPPITPSPATPSPPSAVAWRELLPAAAGGPAAREDHTWTLAGERREAYLFGGRAGRTEFSDLWRYDLETDQWTEVEPTGGPPPARFGHVAAWLEGTGLVIWSGQAGPRFFTDLWVFDPIAVSWRELPASGEVPAARYGSCGGIGPDGRLWISHGFTEDSGRFSDTRAYDFATASWSDVTPAGDRPVERCLHDCLWTPAGDLLLYAGQTTGAPAIGDLWLLDTQTGTWIEQARPAPSPRQLYAVSQLRGTMFVFGGGGSDGAELDDLWQLDLATLAWTEASLSGPSPAARLGATLIADEVGGRLLLFGGRRGPAELADVWQLEVGPAD